MANGNSVVDHHLIPLRAGGTDHPTNRVAVARYLESAWHTLFGDRGPLHTFQQILDFWVPAGFFSRVVVACDSRVFSLDTHHPPGFGSGRYHPAVHPDFRVRPLEPVPIREAIYDLASLIHEEAEEVTLARVVTTGLFAEERHGWRCRQCDYLIRMRLRPRACPNCGCRPSDFHAQ